MSWGWILAWSIPWWLYLVVTIAVAIAALIYIPGKLGTIVVSALVAVGAGWSLYIKGAGEGIEIGELRERSVWEHKVLEEQQRLQEAFQANLRAEIQRREAAETKNEELKAEVEGVYQELEKISDGGAIVIPESIARRLSNIRGRR